MATRAKARTLGDNYTPLRDQVRDEIRERIIDRVYAPGQRIVERELAEELAVSRIPIREAFRMLETEGFVAVLPRRGVVVRELSRRDVEELFDVREALEVLACRRAAERADERSLRKLSKLLDRAKRAISTGDAARIGAANTAFHDEIIALAGNDLLAGLLEPLHGRLHWLFRQTDDPERLWLEHRQLCEAIASGDPDVAAERALHHVRLNRQIALRVLFGDQPDAENPAAG